MRREGAIESRRCRHPPQKVTRFFKDIFNGTAQYWEDECTCGQFIRSGFAEPPGRTPPPNIGG
jgi:hypothetical protein